MTDDPTVPTGAGEALLALQADDLHLDQLTYRKAHLPARAELAALSARRRVLEAARAGINAERKTLTDRQDALEREIDEADGRLRSLDVRASSGEVASFRDQEAVATEMGAISRRKRELEDEELEVMEALEPHDAALASVVAEEESLDATRRALEHQIALDEAEIDRELAIASENRISAAARVPEALLAEYDKLRARLGGIGVARVVHGNCTGCNLHLSATEIDRLHHLDHETLEHCEQCGRLLVP
jgi:predicted  nucleic acid-binding Zn-ribbon protein